ncbi:hypothetical protein J1N35_043843 [Gossypium stocksii]|uniref:Reverse transcriptase domain-containing protein n=1 Tax=Gossypium stocksii TaxID=47602 RepID=A0A9D3ZFE4_9ROSI|nr:hypothetical protein J1N35_043843 [Gossypium stocksii]
MMPVVDPVENISEQIDSAIRNIKVPREDGTELLEAESETLNRRRKNRIEALKLSNRSWSFDNDVLKEKAINFFKNLYTIEGSISGRSMCANYFPQLNDGEIHDLCMKVTDLEVKAVLNSMAPLKAPGIDGLHVKFFQNQ